jgi:hypothetical protein
MSEQSNNIPNHVDWKKFDVEIKIDLEDGTTETTTRKAEGKIESDAERYVKYNLGRFEQVENVEIISVEEINDRKKHTDRSP